ncbi:unnamed protein product [Pedinophyceae sp. YPF-701]|nr:unnamed protein product [Pedinophyceae sp. YPF-701]
MKVFARVAQPGLAPQRCRGASQRCAAKRLTAICRAKSTEEAEATSNGADTVFEGKVDFDELAEIVRKVNDTDIVELELKSRKFNLVMRKKEALEPPVQVVQAAPAPVQAAAPAPAPAAPPSAPAPAPKAAAPEAPKAAPKAGGVEITSPMAGTFYTSPSPSDPPFVKVGDTIQKGQTLCIIEAMKLMNEIEAEVSGTVVDILLDNASPVSIGDPMIIVKP